MVGCGARPRRQGYFVAASRLARVRLSPAGRPSGWARLGSRRVSRRSVWALPSKPPMPAATASSARLAVVPERRVAEVVGEAGGVDDVGAAAERRAELAADLGDLEAVGEPVAHEVVARGLHDLGLGRQPAQAGGVHQAGAVAGEVVAVGALVGGVLGDPALAVGLGVRHALTLGGPPPPPLPPAAPTWAGCRSAGSGSSARWRSRRRAGPSGRRGSSPAWP